MLLITVLKYLFGYFVVVPSFKDINNFYSLLQYFQNEYLYSYSTTFEMSVAVTNYTLHGT